jgi:hypothetical protein
MSFPVVFLLAMTAGMPQAQAPAAIVGDTNDTGGWG